MNENSDITAAEYVVERIIKTSKKDGPRYIQSKGLKTFLPKVQVKRAGRNPIAAGRT